MWILVIGGVCLGKFMYVEVLLGDVVDVVYVVFGCLVVGSDFDWDVWVVLYCVCCLLIWLMVEMVDVVMVLFEV